MQTRPGLFLLKMKEDSTRLEMRCLRNILGVSLRDQLKNEKIGQLLNVDKSLTDMIRKKRMQ